MKSLIKNSATIKKSEKKENFTPKFQNRTTVDAVPKRNLKTKRSCLMCGNMFSSKGPFNRRCSRCSRIVDLGRRDAGNAPFVYKLGSKGNDEFLDLSEYITSKD